MDTAISGEDRSAVLSAHVIKHPAYRRTLDRLHGFLANAYTARGEARCALLSGRARCGKTTIAQILEAEFKSRLPLGGFSGSENHRRTLFVNTPAKATQKSLAETILLTAGDPIGGRGTQAQMTIRVARILKDLRVQLLILDEFHHLVTADTRRFAFETAEWVKTLLNVGVCPILLVGIERVKVVLDTNEQLQGRCWTRAVLKPFGWATPQEQASFRKLLIGFSSVLGTPTVQPLDSQVMAEAMHRATGAQLVVFPSSSRRRAILRSGGGNPAFASTFWQKPMTTGSGRKEGRTARATRSGQPDRDRRGRFR
jgi:hypothetical protein